MGFQSFMANRLKQREENAPGSVRSTMMGGRPTAEVEEMSKGMYKKKPMRRGALTDFVTGLAGEEVAARKKTTLG